MPRSLRNTTLGRGSAPTASTRSSEALLRTVRVRKVVLVVVVSAALASALVARAMLRRMEPHTGGPERMSHLFDVGRDKPLGYLSFWTIEDNGYDAHRLAQDFQDRGFGVLVIDPSAEREAGAVYVYDSEALSRLLDWNREVLLQAGWPVDAKGFVSAVSSTSVRQSRQPALYRLIGRAFRDPRFP